MAYENARRLLLDRYSEHHVESDQTPLIDEREVRRAWTGIQPGDVEECLEFLRKFVDVKNNADGTAASNVYTVVDPVVDINTYDGTWRNTKVESTQGRDKIVRIVQTLRLSLHDFTSAVDWTVARKVEQKEFEAHVQTVIGNGGDAAITQSATDDPAQTMRVRFPNMNPFKLKASIDQFNTANAETVGKPVIEGQTYTGTWDKGMIEQGRADDGSGFFEVTLILSTYTVKLYDNFQTVRQRDKWELFRVPTQYVKEIVDAWKAGSDAGTGSVEVAGRTASVSLNESTGLAHITLSEPNISDQNLDIPDFQTECDTAVDYHFAFGYTEADLVAWASNYEDLAGVGISSTISITARGDGLFDGIVTVTTVTYQIAKHLFPNDGAARDLDLVFTQGSSGITVYKEWGWNISITDLETARDALDNNAGTVNLVPTFEVQRLDNCMFNYQATLTTYAERASTHATTGADGIGFSVTDTKDDPDAPTGPATAARTRHRLETTKNERGSHDHKVTTETVLETPLSNEGGGGTGVLEQVYYAENADELTLPDSAPRVRVSASISANDDKTLRASGKKITTQLVQRDETVADDQIIYANDAQESELPTWSDYTAATDDYVVFPRSAEFTPHPDGTVGYFIRFGKDYKQDYEQDSTANTYRKRHFQRGLNQTSIPPPAGDYVEQIFVENGRSGTKNYLIISSTKLDMTGAGSQNHAFENVSLVDWLGETELAGTGVSSPSIEVVRNIPADNGLFRGRRITRTPIAIETGAAKFYDNGILSVTRNRKYNQASLPAGSSTQHILGPQVNDFGLYDYIEQVPTLDTAYTSQGSGRKVLDNKSNIIGEQVVRADLGVADGSGGLIIPASGGSRTHVGIIRWVKNRNIDRQITRWYSLTPGAVSIVSAAAVGEGRELRTGVEVMGGVAVYWFEYEYRIKDDWKDHTAYLRVEPLTEID